MAAKQRALYKCGECKKVVEIIVGSGAATVCCGSPMTELVAQTAEYKTEKHVPYIERVNGGVKVTVGKEVAHPMTAEHYIVYIEICADGILMRKYLKPGDAPEAFFKTDAENIVAWELCNVHNLWKSNQ